MASEIANSCDPCEILTALFNNNIDLAQELIQNGKPVNIQNEYGVCALHIAVEKNLFDVVKSLLEQGANPNIQKDDAKPHLPSVNCEDFFNTEFDLTIEILEDLQELSQKTSLHIAAQKGLTHIARLLLDFGAFPDIRDSGECTPLHWAATNGDMAFVKLLIERGANPNIQDIAKSSALHEAVRHQHVLIIRYLLENGANPNLVDILGQTPIDLANETPHLQNTLLQYTHLTPLEITKH